MPNVNLRPRKAATGVPPTRVIILSKGLTEDRTRKNSGRELKNLG